MGNKRKIVQAGSESPAVYLEDLGTIGVKKSLVASNSGAETFEMPLTADESKRREKRMKRFATSGKIVALSPTPIASSKTSVVTKSKPGKEQILVGTSTNLEKPYLRLTTFPAPETVRPLAVLMKSMSHIKNQYIKEEDFEWANEQLKSVRQDLTVQRIRNSFALDVYETHARILLENGDLNEFNQCQTMIRSLTSGKPMLEDSNEEVFSENDPFSVVPLKQSEDSQDEFNAYIILYALIQNSSLDLSKSLQSFWGDHRSEDRLDESRCSASRHAMQVVKAVFHGDYRSFFRLFESAPHMSAYLMDFLVHRVRMSAFEALVASYRPTLSVEQMREALQFHDMEETRRFLKRNKAVFVKDHDGLAFWVDCRATSLRTGKGVHRSVR